MEWTLYLTDQFLQEYGYLEGKTEIQPSDEAKMEKYQTKGE
jgi:hypothetical protein